MPVSPDVLLQCRFERTPDALRLTYGVRNGGGAEIGLFNRIEAVRLDGSLSFAPEHVYVDFEDGTLHLRKMVLPIPEGLEMAVRPVPYITRVPAGGTFEESFSLRIPVAVANPLRRASLGGSSPTAEVLVDQPAQAGAVVFSLGAFEVTSDLTFHADFPAHPEVLRVWPPGPPVDRQAVLSCRTELSPPLPVLDYRVVG